MGEPQTVTVLFFAAAKQAAGTARASFDLEPGWTLSQLAELLKAHFGEGLAGVMAGSALWVNGEPGRPTDALRAGDEVAVLPPVSGGANGSDDPFAESTTL